MFALLNYLVAGTAFLVTFLATFFAIGISSLSKNVFFKTLKSIYENSNFFQALKIFIKGIIKTG